MADADTSEKNSIVKILVIAICAIAVSLAGLIGFLLFYEDKHHDGDDFTVSSEPLFDEDDFEGGGAVDSAARIELEKMRQQMEAMQAKIRQLEGRITDVDRRAGRRGPPPPPPPGDGLIPEGQGSGGFLPYTQVVQVAARRQLNQGLSLASPRFLEELLGRPRNNLSDRCEAMTNEKLSSMLVLEEVGPIRVRMLQPAADSLKRVFENVRRADPDLYERINTAGSLCVRQIRGTQGRTSTHSFGLSVDLNIDGKLDTLGDGKTQLGLTILADFFREEGWFWGAAFSREDSMHFEVSRELVTQWREQGKI